MEKENLKNKTEKEQIGKEQEKKPKLERAKEEYEMLIRILDHDIPGSKLVYVGLTRIKGVSWAFSNAICKLAGIGKNKKISELSKEEIKRIEETILSPKIPAFLMNRRNDIESGSNIHIVGTDLDLRKDFDIKLLKKIRSYRGLRHSLGLPTRGQRTRNHFREHKKSRVSVGVQKKKEVKSK